MRASTIIALSAAGATALLALSGCAGGSVPGTGGATVPSETPAAATTASEAPTTPVPSLAECLTGSWVLPEDQVVAFYSAASADLPELSFEPFGTLGLELRADGGYRYLPAFGFVLTLDLGFGQLTPRAEVSGDVTGTWSAEGDTLVLTDTNSSLSVAAELDGQPLDVAAATDALLEESPMLTPPGAVSCDDNTMTMPKDAGTGGIIEVQWARAG